MSSAQNRLETLYRRWLSGSLTEAETHEWIDLLKDKDLQKTLSPIQQEIWNQQEDEGHLSIEAKRKLARDIIATYPAEKETPIKHLPSYKRWIRWSAVAILILAIGSGVYYWGTSKLKVISNKLMVVKNDILPGGNRAILTVGNQTITLSSNKTGININNTITYSDGEKIADAGQLLQLTTPRGGQYQAVLPDGSKVWLNAASSIKFPSKFNDKERRVEVSGEAYFEVAKDATRSFKVQARGQEIEVLGTSFNINVYDDEPIKKTTLITGKIRVSVGAALVAAQNPTANAVRATTRVAPTIILNPNEQAQVSTISEITQIKQITVQTNDVIAWTNGLFHFNNSPLEEVMRQLSRWYNINIQYSGTIPKRTFNGELTRDLQLSQVLEILSQMKLKFNIQENNLIISN